MISEPRSTADVARLEREHELFLRLLRVGVQHEIEPFLRDALALIVEVAGADHGYLELHDDTASDGRWWIAHGFSEGEIAKVREAISKGIIAQALATGRTVTTPSA